jgi:hypothetical protein
MLVLFVSIFWLKTGGDWRDAHIAQVGTTDLNSGKF